jgi:hypothetical protein
MKGQDKWMEGIMDGHNLQVGFWGKMEFRENEHTRDIFLSV